MSIDTLSITGHVAINIWDDFHEDGYVPEGEVQETYAYIESDMSMDIQRKVLAIFRLHLVTNYTELLAGVEFREHLYDTAVAYPEFAAQHPEMVTQRWELRMKHITHEMLEKLIEGCRSSVHWANVYSES